MKTPRANSKLIPAPPTDAEIARALASQRDSILPSSGFTSSVMAAITHDASAPAPIPFPWKRALPGFAAIAVALALLIATLVSMAFSAPSAPSAAAQVGSVDNAALMPFLHSTQNPNVVIWTAVTLGACIVSLVYFRRLLTTR